MKLLSTTYALICGFLVLVLFLASSVLYGPGKGLFVDSEYARLSADFKFLSDLAPKLDPKITSTEFQKLAVETFNSAQQSIHLDAEPHPRANPFTIGRIEFYFNEDGSLGKVERGELELTGFDLAGHLITPPSPSYVFGKGDLIGKFNSGGYLMYFGILLILLFLFALIQYLSFEFGSRNPKRLAHSSLTLCMINFLSFISLFSWHLGVNNRWFKSVDADYSFNLNIEHLLQRINEIAIFPSLLFDLMIISFILTMIVQYKINRNANPA